jgi:hypothetical protein
MAINGNPERLTSRKKRAIAALLTSRDIKSAALAARVGERTLHRWLDNKSFRDALQVAESEAIDAATRRLIGLEDSALDAFVDVFDLASSQERVNLSDFISEEPRAVKIGRGDNARTVYLESGCLNWDKVKERGDLIKKISFNQYGPILELYDAQTAARLKLDAAQSVIDFMMKLREFNTTEARLLALEKAAQNDDKGY